MANDTILILGGIYNLLIAIFHLSFWRIFNWHQDLKSLRYVNRAVMQILNLSLTFVFFIFAYISFTYTYELLITRLGHSIIASISVFWFLRAFMQVAFFGMKNKVSVLIFIIFLIGGIIYLYPML